MKEAGFKKRPLYMAIGFGLLILIAFLFWNKNADDPKVIENTNFVETKMQLASADQIAQPMNRIETIQYSQGILHELTPKSDNFIKVKGSAGNFTSRISDYNEEIDKLRTEIKESRKLADWQDIGNSSNRNVFWCNRDDFMMLLASFKQVKTVLLPWVLNETTDNRPKQWSTLTDNQNVLIQKYYEWTASDPLCGWIESPNGTKARYDAVFNRTCNRDTTRAFIPKSLEHVYFHGKPINVRDYWPNYGDSYPNYFYNELPDYVLYMHVLEDGLITGAGDVLTGDFKLVPYGCSQDVNPEPPPRYEQTPIYSEVFVATQFWGDTFYHKMLEVLPRLAPYEEFLRKNKNIKIHVAEEHGMTKGLLKFLDFDPTRIISGSTRAKIVYLPQATPCGFPQPQEVQLLSAMYRERIQTRLNPEQRNLVIFIHRSGLRHFSRQIEIESIVERLATQYGYEYTRFGDRPSPPLELAMQMFAQAAMVVAPHGAGLSNLIFSQPGTVVIEGVCNRPHVNLCYQWSCHIMGHRYHAIPARQGCEDVVDIEPSLVEVVMTTYLELMKQYGL